MTPTATRQQLFTGQYNALDEKLRDASFSVDRFERIAGISTSNPTPPPLTAYQQSAYDQVRQQHLDAHAELTSFLRDTATSYGRIANEYGRVPVDLQRSEAIRLRASV